ncbi:MAG: ABC transporter substrate-binding protein, partial [Arachnia propionica]
MIRRGLVLMGFAAACFLSACVPGADAPGTSPAPTAATSSAPAPGVTPVTPALTATGPDGAEVSVPAAPQRIVCLTGICDDILASLGIVPVATSTPNLATRPEIFGDKGKDIPVVPGSFGAEDTSFAAEVKPDLVIGLAGVHEALKPALEKFSPVLLVNVKTDEDSLAYLRMVATLTGKADAQVKAETAYQEAMAAAKQKAA